MIYTLFVNNYNINWSKNDNIICISMPNFSVEMNESDRLLPESLMTKFRELNWSPKAITNFKNYLQEKNCDSGMRLNPKTGSLTL